MLVLIRDSETGEVHIVDPSYTPEVSGLYVWADYKVWLENQ